MKRFVSLAGALLLAGALMACGAGQDGETRSPVDGRPVPRFVYDV